MKNLIFLLVLAIIFVSCNSLKRLDKLAAKYGEEITNTISIDTTLRIQGVSFDATYTKKYAIADLVGQIDTTRINLQDGTEVILIDQYIAENGRPGDPEKIAIKRRALIFRDDKEIHILKNRQYKRISVTPPDKMDVFLANFKWFALSILGVFGIVLLVRKMFF